MRMKERGNPPGRIVLRRRGRESIVQGGLFVGSSSLKQSRTGDLDNTVMGHFQRARVLFRPSTSFGGQSIRMSGERRAASHTPCTLSTAGCARDARDVLEVLAWFFLFDSACGMAERTRASTMSVKKACSTEAAAVAGGALPSDLVKALADGGMAAAKAAKRGCSSAVITGSHTAR